jgi:hypothetical protein
VPHSIFTSDSLQVAGPIIELVVGAPQAVLDALERSGQPKPPPLIVSALIDTGAGMTGFRTGVLDPLGLPLVGYSKVYTAGVVTSASLHSVRLGVVSMSKVIGEFAVLDIPLEGQNLDCLIGRDVLSHATFVYQGFGNTYSLSF